MIKAAVLVVLGAIGALELERRLSGLKGRMSPRAMTDSVLARANRRLERDRSTS